ncbi:hypothetical protein FG87_08225 [Nocardia vulneris]|uniref:Cyclic nucleotide-binding domain-containing protein n=1 Tax=Nocardia vulneris TaxID=1141657 RepID=A0ABR4ZJX6_9NOCA|nr:hypothetical protein FG87_08225 [Nocardia vulneris]
MVVGFGNPMDQIFLVVHGKLSRIGTGEYNEPQIVGRLTGEDYFGDAALTESLPIWPETIKTLTPGTRVSRCCWAPSWITTRIRANTS